MCSIRSDASRPTSAFSEFTKVQIYVYIIQMHLIFYYYTCIYVLCYMIYLLFSSRIYQPAWKIRAYTKTNLEFTGLWGFTVTYIYICIKINLHVTQLSVQSSAILGTANNNRTTKSWVVPSCPMSGCFPKSYDVCTYRFMCTTAIASFLSRLFRIKNTANLYTRVYYFYHSPTLYLCEIVRSNLRLEPFDSEL